MKFPDGIARELFMLILRPPSYGQVTDPLLQAPEDLQNFSAMLLLAGGEDLKDRAVFGICCPGLAGRQKLHGPDIGFLQPGLHRAGISGDGLFFGRFPGNQGENPPKTGPLCPALPGHPSQRLRLPAPETPGQTGKILRCRCGGQQQLQQPPPIHRLPLFHPMLHPDPPFAFPPSSLCGRSEKVSCFWRILLPIALFFPVHLCYNPYHTDIQLKTFMRSACLSLWERWPASAGRREFGFSLKIRKISNICCANIRCPPQSCCSHDTSPTRRAKRFAQNRFFNTL